MGRVIIRRGARNTVNNGASDGHSIGIESANTDTVSDAIRTHSGEPDADDFQPAGNDNKSGESVNADGARFVEPTSATGGTSEGTPKRRGRKPGSRNKTSRADSTKTSQDLAAILFSTHLMLAQMIKSPVWMITQDESEKLGAAITRVTELYDVSIIPEKQLAWLNLILVSGSVYGPRLYLGNKKKAPVHQIRPNVVTTIHSDEAGVTA